MPPEPAQPFANYQYEIYLAGLADQKPKYPLTYAEMEAAARERLSAEAYGYVAGAAGAETTARFNREAFDRWRIVPRMLRDTSRRDLAPRFSARRCRRPSCLRRSECRRSSIRTASWPLPALLRLPACRSC